MMSICAFQVINVQGDPGMIDKTLKKFPEQIHVKTADHGFRVFNVIEQAGTAGKINHYS